MTLSVRVLGGALLLMAGTVSAQEATKRSASDAAAAFTLDGLPAADTAAVPPVDPAVLPEAQATTAPVTPSAATDAATATDSGADGAAQSAAPTEAPAPPAVSRFTLDTPIVELIADPRSRKVLDREMPGLSTDQNLDKFRTLSLRGFQPLTGGQLTDTLLAKIAVDLAAIPPAKPRIEGR